MTTEETAAQIAEFTVAKLDVKPGDVVVVKCNEPPLVMKELSDALSVWADARELGLHFLVVHDSFDLNIVHTLTPEEVDKAGAGGWPHEKETT